MSAILSERTVSPAVTTVTPSLRTTPRHVFPVGARFPRRTAAQDLAYLTGTHSPSTGHAPVFPVGARFPRRTDADAVLYLAEIAATGRTTVTSTRRVLPVGARFPRH